MSEQATDTLAARNEEDAIAPRVAAGQRRPNIFAQYSTEGRLAIFLVALIVFFLLLIGRKFVGRDNLESMAFQLPELGILSLAMMVSLLHGGVNLSIISTANLSALTTAYLLTTALPGTSGLVWVAWLGGAIAAGFAVSVVVGLLNGAIIAYVGVSPILTTLGTMILLKGLALGLTRGTVISGFPPQIRFIGGGLVLGVPFGMFLLVTSILLVAIILGRTPFGAAIYLMGSNERATQYSGINTRHVILGIYVMSGILSALAGLVMLSRFNSANAAYGESYLLVTVLAAILGGTDPYGGLGKVSGLVFAILILQVVASAFNQMELSQFLTLAIWGLILIVVSGITYLRSYRTTR